MKPRPLPLEAEPHDAKTGEVCPLADVHAARVLRCHLVEAQVAKIERDAKKGLRPNRGQLKALKALLEQDRRQCLLEAAELDRTTPGALAGRES
jgi:hypothetical protein